MCGGGVSYQVFLLHCGPVLGTLVLVCDVCVWCVMCVYGG